MRSEGIYVNKNSTDTSWDRTSDLPNCSTASTPYVEEIIGDYVVFETTGKLLILYSANFKQGIPVAFEHIINKTIQTQV